MPQTFPFRRLPTYTLAALVLLIIAVSGALYEGHNQAEANRLVIHTVQVQKALTEVLERTRAFESSVRGYLLEPRPQLILDFNKAAKEANASVAKVRALTRDNPDQVRNSAQLKQMLNRRVAYSRQTIAIAESKSSEEIHRRITIGYGSVLSDTINRKVAQMAAIEEDLLRRRGEHVQQMVWLLSSGLAVALFLVALIAGIIIVDARNRFAAIEAARDEARLSAKAAQAEMVAREVAEAQLRQIQKMESIGQLTGGIAHDFNNMLAIVIGSLDLAERRLKTDPDKALKGIQSARQGAERAATLTNRLLAFSRQQPLAPLAIDANQMVSGMSELLRRTLGEQIAIEIVLAGGLWQSFADISQLENAILNLAVNSRDAMPDGGRLTIETANAHLDEEYAATRPEAVPGQYVMISVSDSGSGMPADIIARAFDPFFTTKEVGKGTGLGLSQVYGFVKQSGGHIAIYSELDQGTTVKIYLPRYSGKVTAPATTAIPVDNLPEGNNEEIVLIVEDEERVRHFSVDVLRDLGYTAISTGSGREALTILAEQPLIVMLFTDIMMPEMNGRRLADEARLLKPDIKVLFTTGYTRNAVVHNGMLDAGVAFLPKPFTMAQLALKVRAVLDGGGANRPL